MTTLHDQLTAKGQATRERIVLAAAEVINERGPAQTTVDEVIARAGASKSQLYHYFASRDELIRAAVQVAANALLELQGSMMGQLDSWRSIRSWFDCLVSLQVDLGGRGGCPLASLTAALAETDEQVRAELIAAFNSWEGHLARGLESMRAAGDLQASADTAKLATATMAAVQGGLLLTQVRRDPGQLELALDAAYDYLRGFVRRADAADPA